MGIDLKANQISLYPSLFLLIWNEIYVCGDKGGGKTCYSTLWSGMCDIIARISFLVFLHYLAWDIWDGIYCGYWCRHRSKDCSKAHHLPSRASPFGLAGLFQRTISTTITCVQTSSHRPERPDYYIQIWKGRCPSPQKEEVTRIHWRRKPLQNSRF